MSSIKTQIVTGLVVIALVAGYVLIGAWPQQNALADIRHDTARLQDEVLERTSTGELAKAAETDLQKVRRTLTEVRRQVPTEDGLGDFLEHLATLTQDCNLANAAVAPEKIYQTADIFTQPIHVSFVSTFDSLVTFLQRLEESERIVYIKDVNTRMSDEAPGQLYSALTVQIYFGPLAAYHRPTPASGLDLSHVNTR